MARTSPNARTSVDPETLAAIVARVRREGAVKPASLRLGKLTRAAEVELVEALGREGLEHTGKAIRVPVADQLRVILEAAAAEGVVASAVPRAVKGARSAAEVALVLRTLSDEGFAAPVVHGRSVRWTRRAASVLGDAELDELASLAKVLSDLAKVTKPAKAKPRSAVVRVALADAARRLANLAGIRSGSAIPDAVDAALRAAPDAGGLVRVPDVVRRLERDYPLTEVLRAIEALARAGRIELRPEAGVGRLSDDDVRACTSALDGTPLSYARIVSGSVGGS